VKSGTGGVLEQVRADTAGKAYQAAIPIKVDHESTPPLFNDVPNDGNGGRTPFPDSDEFIGESPLFRQALEEADRLAAGDDTVLIRGETGTGTKLVARRIHRKSPRAAGPFVVFDCGGAQDRLSMPGVHGRW
jgi:transcriptional regulator with PAS, ATPase and Fis domain